MPAAAAKTIPTSMRSMLSRGDLPVGQPHLGPQDPEEEQGGHRRADQLGQLGSSIWPSSVSATAATGKVAYRAKPNRERTGPMTHTAPIPPIAS